MPDLLNLATSLVLAVCASWCLLIAGVGIVWTIRRRRVAASSQEQAHHQSAARAQVGGRDVAEAVHELPARGHRGDALAARAHRGRDGRGRDDVREHGASARMVPVVQEALQPGGGRQARRAGDELETTAAEAAGQAAAHRSVALVIWQHAIDQANLELVRLAPGDDLERRYAAYGWLALADSAAQLVEATRPADEVAA